MFFTFDGVDGVGKSTQIRLLADWLREQGREVVTCRDPGGTALGETAAGLLLDHHDVPIHRRSEMLLYMASRAQLVEEVIRPALAAGKVVVSDRYLLANVVYQAHAGGPRCLDDDVWRVGEVTVGGVMPRTSSSCSTCRPRGPPPASSARPTGWNRGAWNTWNGSARAS